MAFVPVLIASGSVAVSTVAVSTVASFSVSRWGISSVLASSWAKSGPEVEFASLREGGVDFTRTRFTIPIRKHTVIGYHYQNITPHEPYDVLSFL